MVWSAASMTSAATTAGSGKRGISSGIPSRSSTTTMNTRASVASLNGYASPFPLQPSETTIQKPYKNAIERQIRLIDISILNRLRCHTAIVNRAVVVVEGNDQGEYDNEEERDPK